MNSRDTTVGGSRGSHRNERIWYEKQPPRKVSRRNKTVRVIHGEGDPARTSVQGCGKKNRKAGIDSACRALIAVTMSKNKAGRIHSGGFIIKIIIFFSHFTEILSYGFYSLKCLRVEKGGMFTSAWNKFHLNPN